MASDVESCRDTCSDRPFAAFAVTGCDSSTTTPERPAPSCALRGRSRSPSQDSSCTLGERVLGTFPFRLFRNIASSCYPTMFRADLLPSQTIRAQLSPALLPYSYKRHIAQRCSSSLPSSFIHPFSSPSTPQPDHFDDWLVNFTRLSSSIRYQLIETRPSAKPGSTSAVHGAFCESHSHSLTSVSRTKAKRYSTCSCTRSTFMPLL